MVEFALLQLMQVARLSVWLALLILLFVPLERLCFLHPSQYLKWSTASDIAFYFLNSLVPNIMLIVPTAVLALALHNLMPDAYLAYVASLPMWVRLPAVLVVAEVGTYWGHRWSHEMPWLWRFHAVHHTPEHIHFLTNTRAHPVDMVFTRLCGLVPIYVFGLAHVSGDRTDLAPMLVILFGTVWGFFIHANVRWRLGWFEALIATPAFHHWHHTNDEFRDRNYAALFPWIDRLFGTLHLPKTWPPSYGVDEPLPPGFGPQLLHPFKRTTAERMPAE